MRFACLGIILLAVLPLSFGLSVANRLEAQEYSRRQLELDKTDMLKGPLPGKIPGTTVWLDAKTEEIRRLEGHVTVSGAKTPKEAADRFLSTSLGFRLERGGNAFLTLSRETESLTGTQLLYQVYYGNTDVPGGLPILDGTVTIFVDRDNGISAVANNVARVTKPRFIRSSKLLDSQAAEEAARRKLAKDSTAKFTNVTQGVLVSKGEPIAVWKMNQLVAKPAGVLEIIVSAESGELLKVSDVAQHNSAI